MAVTVEIQRLPNAAGLDLPAYATEGSADMDLVAAVEQEIELAPGRRALIPTGLKIALPGGFEAQVRPRSGTALKSGLTVLNTPGTIDSDYRGEIGIILANLGEAPFTVSRGMRIAQLVVAPVVRVAWRETGELPRTVRSDGGFGSTGTGAA